jgi:hypothetical protein
MAPTANNKRVVPEPPQQPSSSSTAIALSSCLPNGDGAADNDNIALKVGSISTNTNDNKLEQDQAAAVDQQPADGANQQSLLPAKEVSASSTLADANDPHWIVATLPWIFCWISIWGRPLLSAALSFGDTTSDLLMIRNFLLRDEIFFAILTMVTVILNLLFQFLIIFVQTRNLQKNRLRTFCVDCVLTATMLKPGVDAYKVTTNAEQQPGQALDALTELNYSKVVEMFCEAIPGLLIQSFALITSNQTASSKVPIFSLLMSAFSIGMIATTIAFESDTNLVKRRESPEIYGMVPDAGRGVTFLVMFAFSTTHVVLKALSSSLLMATDPLWFLYYMTGDISIYLAQKVIRRDMIYWAPVPLSISILVSMTARVMVKVISDYSGSLLFRHPFEMGGIYFSFNLIMTQVSLPVCVYLYNKDSTGENKLNEQFTWIFVLTLMLLWFALLSFLVFYIIVPEYKQTFWSCETGWENSQSYFLDNEGNDARRVHIFTTNPIHWRSIKEDVKVWTLTNWSKWEEEKPDWFNLVVKAQIPDDFIPADAVLALGGALRARRGSARQSSSVGDEVVEFRRRLSFAGGEDREIESGMRAEAQ